MRIFKLISDTLRQPVDEPVEAEDSLDKERLRVLECKYFDTMELVQRNYSVIYQSGATDGQAVYDFVYLCSQNITDYKLMHHYQLKLGIEPPHSVPAYDKLSLLFERMGLYDKAFNTCAEAVKLGVRGSIQGRGIRVAKKAGIEIEPELLEYFMK